jgi:tRNA(fMet)-specific endonuclease VapC
VARLLLDTNICIYIAREKPPAVLAQFRRYQRGDLAMSAITFGELLYGAAKSTQRERVREVLRELIAWVPALPVDDAVSERYGALRATLEQRDRPIGNNDLWIAAHTLALGIPLVTNNEREFARVPGLKVLNWAR